MKLRLFAFAMACAALAACDGGPTLSEWRLIGRWQGDERPYTVQLAGQVRTVQGHVEVSFFPNSTYRRAEVLHDPVLNRDFVEQAEKGTYFTRDDKLILRLVALYQRSGGEPQAAPPLERFEGRGVYGFRLENAALTVNWCPLGAYCVGEFITRLTRVAAGPRAD